jgi:site-specific DNA-cytosine methylase
MSSHPISSPLYKEQPDLNYIKNEVKAAIEGFPEGYFKRPGLKLSKKEIIKMIGNAVPVGMARALLEPMAKYLIESELERVAV